MLLDDKQAARAICYLISESGDLEWVEGLDALVCSAIRRLHGGDFRTANLLAAVLHGKYNATATLDCNGVESTDEGFCLKCVGKATYMLTIPQADSDSLLEYLL